MASPAKAIHKNRLPSEMPSRETRQGTAGESISGMIVPINVREEGF